MYFKENTAIGHYIFTGSRVKATRYLLGIDENVAIDACHKIHADVVYAKLNNLSKQQVSRLKKTQRKIKFLLKKKRFSEKVSSYGNKINTFSIPHMDVFFRLNKGREVAFHSDGVAVLHCNERLVISKYVEGDVIEYHCKDSLNFHMELDSILSFFRNEN